MRLSILTAVVTHYQAKVEKRQTKIPGGAKWSKPALTFLKGAVSSSVQR